jgi:hypothetical protein
VSNNGAEYEALIHGMRIAISLGITRLNAYGDSKVVINQVNKTCDMKKDTMDAYCVEVRKLEAHFEGLIFHHVCHEKNMAADILSKMGSKRVLLPTGVFVQDLRKPSIKLLGDLEPPPGDVPLVDGHYNKDLTVKTLGLRGVYDKFHAHFWY